MQKLDSWSPGILSVLRIIVGLVFLQHGTQKVLHFPPPAAAAMKAVAGAAMKAAAAAAPHAPTLAAILGKYSGYFELIGGALIVVGLFSRVTAFILSGEMAFAYFLAHFPRSVFPILNGGDLAVLFCFTFFYFVFSGPGPISLDAMVFRKKL
jgi:putative oxidoreductase